MPTSRRHHRIAADQEHAASEGREMENDDEHGGNRGHDQNIVGNAVKTAGADHAEKRRHIPGWRTAVIGVAAPFEHDPHRKRGQKGRHRALGDQQSVREPRPEADQQRNADDRQDVAV
jgi:hypothetical protein